MKTQALLSQGLRHQWNRSVALVTLLFCLGCGGWPGEDKFTVFCAASLGEPVQTLCHQLSLEARLHRGGSYTLLRQYEQGAPADLLLLADDALLSDLDAVSRSLASNRLVVIQGGSPPARKLRSVDDVFRNATGRLAIADPTTAPLGRYTEQALKRHPTGALQRVPLKDAKAVVAAVSLGHAEFGIAYATDASADPSVVTVARIPEQSHPPILYTAVLLSDKPQAKSLFESLTRGAGQDILKAHGFESAPGAASKS